MASFRTSRQLTRAQFTNLLEELSSSMEVSEFREFADFLQSSFKVNETTWSSVLYENVLCVEHS